MNTSRGLETVEALLEDLSFRNLELHDRERLLKTASAKARSKGNVTFSIDGWPAGVFNSRTDVKHRSGPRSAGLPAAVDLASYVRLLSRLQPGAVVSGRFSDWRTTSVYRSMSGYHNGYDIAYPPGTPIAAGWPGQVVSIANWYGSEYGITVESPQGFRTTYGHLSPATHVGAWVNPGEVLGRVVNDHVDVKMRSVGGGFIDFGRGVPGVGRGGDLACRGTGPVTSRGSGGVVVTFHVRTVATPGPRLLPPLAGPPWSRRAEAVRAAIAYLRVRHQEATLLMQGDAAPAGALAAARRQVDEARGRLLENGVPEEVLTAAFLPIEPLREGGFWQAGALNAGAQVDVIDDENQRQDEMIRGAQDAVPALKSLLRDLNAQPPAPRRS